MQDGLRTPGTFGLRRWRRCHLRSEWIVRCSSKGDLVADRELQWKSGASPARSTGTAPADRRDGDFTSSSRLPLQVMR